MQLTNFVKFYNGDTYMNRCIVCYSSFLMPGNINAIIEPGVAILEANLSA